MDTPSGKRLTMCGDLQFWKDRFWEVSSLVSKMEAEPEFGSHGAISLPVAEGTGNGLRIPTEGSLTIDQLCDTAYQTADEKGFHPPTPLEPTTLEEALAQLRATREQLRMAYFFQRIMLVVTELVEAVEAMRKGHDPDLTYYYGGKPEGIPSEMADAFIRLADMCKEFGIPITEAIREKMAYNRTRPPMHGKKC